MTGELNLLIFITIYNNINEFDNIRKALIQKMETVKGRLIKITAKRLWLTSDYMLETFMLGSSGPAYAMLRMHHNKYPSVLSLDII